MAVRIQSVGSYVPQTVLTNDELATRIDTSDEWIHSHTGIRERRIADSSESTSDLAVHASRSALQKAGLTPEDIDLVIVATATPDYNGFPSTACIVQEKLGIKVAPAFDITAGCSGFVFAVEAARGQFAVNPKIRRALVIGAETITRMVDWEDRNTCVLFGDGAGAVVLERTEGNDPGIHASFLGSDGSGWDKIINRRGGSSEPILAGETFSKPPALSIDGRAVYTFAVHAMCEIMERLSSDTGIALSDIDHVVPHQANVRIIQAAAKRMGFPESRFFLNMDKFANTSAASVPIALADMDSRGLLKKGDTVMILAFGAGLTYGGSVLTW